MRAPLEWLKEHVTIRLTPGALAERLTMVEMKDAHGHRGPVSGDAIT